MLSLKPSLLLLCVTKFVAFDKSEAPLLCYKVYFLIASGYITVKKINI